ncbi:MAG: exodeoxyribonuclease III [Ignavibacteriaceae bacterium]|nr:MAG: exodeoxyribonuclease III [Chlorobiota bacterium]MBV6399484.1 Exodeoxyribonuclease [Ignavibacteria bacterium]MCC6886672.1 exodeoxyribonuclease III [Ignavibacteriales bacterium]MCE7953190.1 exodeoxyribonuclease III [Chlorobi bacterium CHB7]MEB2329028.1 exodeoxyribonuclease III [Ignavibacteriaceae bacterium]RIK50061.1 MAG: exodeoxyribonuclease III [Ignavibacteriota bacterium]
MRIFTWNINGIRAAVKKGFLEWFKETNPDILCLQETKAQFNQLDDSVTNINGYKSYWFSAERKGYSSVATFTKFKPVEVLNGFGKKEFDSEGRVIFTEFNEFVLANVYFPNGGRGPERLKYKLDFYDELFFYINKNYKSRKGIIITGDFNTAHNEIDLAKPQQWSKVSGFLNEERAWIERIINLGYVDVFRVLNPDVQKFTYWDQISRARQRNEGWRIDYFMVSEDIAGKVTFAEIHDTITGSDHCPVSINIEIN